MGGTCAHKPLKEDGMGTLSIKPESLRFPNNSQYNGVKGILLLPSASVARI